MKKVLLLIFCLLFYSFAFAGFQGGFYDPDTDLSNIPKNLIPLTDDTYDIGSSAKKWKDFYVDGVAYIDSLSMSGDLEFGNTPYSIDGGTQGLAFDPDNDTTNEVTISTAGTITTEGNLAVNGGNITSSAALNIKAAGDTDDYLTISTPANVPSLYGTGAYLRVGDAATTANSLDNEDDLMVTGELECYSNLYSGANQFSADAGLVDAFDMPVSATPADNTVEGYNFKVDGNSIMTVYSQADHAGAVDTMGVGIGTTVPLTKLDVVDTSTSSPRGILSRQFSTDTNGARMGFAKARGTLAAPTTIVTGDTLGRLMFRGYDGTNYLEMASIEAISSGTITTTRVPTYLAISTGTDATPSVLTERMRIDNTGNVGIGTTEPKGKLAITNTIGFDLQAGTAGTIGQDSILLLNGANGSGDGKYGPGISFGFPGDGTSIRRYASIASVQTTADGDQIGLSFITHPGILSTDALVEAMRITATGNVGIGTTAPEGLLEVQGVEATDAKIYLDADDGDDNADTYIISSVAADNTMTITNHTTVLSTLSSAGAYKWNTYGAGTLTTDASGNITAVSDGRLKDIKGDFSRGLSAIKKIEPIVYNWNEKSGLDTKTLYAGFSAQDILKVIPEAVGQNDDGYYTISDRPIIAALVNAVKEQQIMIDKQTKDITELKKLINYKK